VSIWFYLFLVVLFVATFLILKVFIMNQEIKNISYSLTNILDSDTNNLITVNSNNKGIKSLAISLNKNLKVLRDLELEYKNGNSEVKTLITNISHDLRTPLTVIRGYLDLMDSKKFSGKERKYLDIIANKVNDLTFLTEELFDYFKKIDFKNEIKKENVCLNTVLEETLISFYCLFEKNNIKPQVDICENKVVRLVNLNMIKRIFENIISNVIKYGENDFNVIMNSEGLIRFCNKTNKLDKVSFEKMFNRYYTVRNAKKSSGVGLSIVKQLVILNGGEIKALYERGYLIIEILFT